MLEVRNLGKTYRGGVKALDGIDLSIPAGMYGLLGPNGAGKSTLMRTMAAIQLPDRGSVVFDGLDALADPVALRRRLGYLPQAFGAYPHASCQTMLRHLAVLKGLPDDAATARQIDALLDCTNLTAHAARAVTTFSGGMRQRFGIAQALLGDPALLILDEPTAGLDPEERIRLYNLLSQLSGDRVVVLSTHIVDDIEQLCSKMAIIHAGKVVAQGNIAGLVEKLDGHIWQSPVAAPNGSPALQLSMAYRRGSPVYRYFSRSSPGDSFVPVPPTLEDRYFLELRGDRPC
ncbi:MAG: ABC transporter ATP-binding protein [Novosphingobium sp.]|uniref:ABC transporter ATP-binding protein n=1 Tax=Novosphingobium sp. TaxID=1874826 RepID=UPI0017E2F1F2|nr:ABC transporter ATP-binding protein [Novosphingobium sp.]